jgi:isopenicillin N synthase-like dioxygenase
MQVAETLKGTERIPDSPGFFSSLMSLAHAYHPVIERLHQIFARALQLEDVQYFNKVSRAFKDPKVPSFSTFRSILYLPITEDVVPGSVRCAQHTDYGTVTLLFQDQMGGLEVKKKFNRIENFFKQN